MPNTTILDLAELPQYAASSGPRRSYTARHWLAAAAFGALLALGLSLGAAPLARALGFAGGRAQGTIAFNDLPKVEDLSVDDKAQIVVEGEAAQEQNAAIPFSGQPLEQVRSFALGGAVGKETYANALKCLSQAVYYEAAVEPLDGRRAVAQVVLNRVRHPAYPKSVCGVVYQGAERGTGCQFSFTCDGALLREPAAGPWREAQAVAKAALAGYVERSVGTATFYHADYVLPKWAFEFGKINQIGRHIFYRFNGGWGQAQAFTGRYAGLERIPALDFAALRERALAEGTLPEEQQFVPGLTVAPDVTDRHAEADVGGRIDMTKAWRPSIPDPTETSSHLSAIVAQTNAQSAQKVAANDATGAQAKQ